MNELPASQLGIRKLRRFVPPRYRSRIELMYAYPLLAEWDRGERFPKPRSGAQGNGVRFERKVLAGLSAQSTFIPSLPFRYQTTSGYSSFCIPDGVWFGEQEVVCIEVKLQHTVHAWFQLNNLYIPVLERAFRKPVRALEVVKVLDPEVRFPCSVRVFRSVESFVESQQKLGVCLWRPQYGSGQHT